MKILGAQSLTLVQELLESQLPTRPRVYEAGGGSASVLPRSILKEAEVTVVDIDPTQLKNNRYAATKILGDIQTYTFAPASFDAIVCFNVIEHLNDPEKAIRLFYDSLAPKGLIFIGAPVRNSLSGWVTRVTPHWFHVLYYRWVLKYSSAGKPGSVPFPTIFHPIVQPERLLKLCRELGCEVKYFCQYRGMIYENMSERRPLLGRLLLAMVSILNLAAVGRKDLRDGDFHLVITKPATRRADSRLDDDSVENICRG